MLSGIKVETTEKASNVVPVRFSGISGNDVTRKYYKGKSFRWAGVWKSGEHYFNDEYIVDFVSIDGAMCICEKSHYSTEDNKPVLKFDESGSISGLVSTKYWQISLNVQGAVDVANKSIRYDIEQNLTETQKLRARINIGAVSSKELDDAIKAIKIGTAQIADEAVTEEKLSPSLVAKINATVDTKMSDESTNAVQNKIIKAYVDKQKSELATQIQLVSGNLDAVKQDVHDEHDRTNAAITELQTETGSLKAKITTLETTSTEQAKQITGLDNRVAVLEGKTYEDPRVDELVTTAADHETRIKTLETSGGTSADLTEIKKTLATHTTEITDLDQRMTWSEQ